MCAVLCAKIEEISSWWKTKERKKNGAFDIVEKECDVCSVVCEDWRERESYVKIGG